MGQNFLSKVIILAITLTVLWPVGNFYFWHDDFSTFYGPRTGQCIFDWPYLQFCPMFNFLLKVFGYNPFPYFVIGIILAGFTVVMFYLLMKEFFDKKTAFFSTLIYSTFYIGAGVFQEAYDPIISFPALSLLFLSMILIHKNKFIAGLGVFALSVLSFSARAGSHFFPLMALIALFVKRSLSKKIILLFLVGVTFFVTFFFSPVSSSNFFASSKFDILGKAKLFLQTSGSLILTDEMNLKDIDLWRTIIALGLYVICIIFIFKDRNKFLLFALIWVFTMYLPYGLRADFRLVTTHRYLVFVIPGVLMAWAAFSKYKYWTFVSLMVFGVYSIFSYGFLRGHLRISNLRRSFYNQLHALVPKLSGDETLYFDAPNALKNQMNDFFRVGYTSSESALGSEYGLKSDNLKIISEGEVLVRYKDQNPLMFYYDGETLVKTNVTDYLFTKSISLSANLNSLINKCDSCNYSTDEVVKAYKYIEISRKLKKQVKIEVQSSGDDTLASSMVDDDDTTYWIGRRQEWVVNKNIDLKFNFIDPINLQNIRFVTMSNGHKPIEVIFNGGYLEVFDLKITKTDGEDVPVINEINFVPKGFEDVNFELVDKIVNSGLLLARNDEENQALESYLMTGTKVCLQWSGGQKDLIIIPDGRRRTYTVNLPTVGPNITKFTIGCLESYPVVVSDYSD